MGQGEDKDGKEIEPTRGSKLVFDQGGTNSDDTLPSYCRKVPGAVRSRYARPLLSLTRCLYAEGVFVGIKGGGSTDIWL